MKKTYSVFFGFSILFCACSASNNENADPTDNRGLSVPRSDLKADAALSCAGSCGKQAPGGCWCDNACEKYGDCCSDKSQHCANKPASCAGFCGKKNPAGCWCDKACAKYGDCCFDKAAICDAPPPPELCADVTCSVAPPACQGNNLVTTLSNTCNPQTGKCEATTSSSPCDYGCNAGACLPDPCANVSCTPDAPYCNGDDLITSTAASCDPASGDCVQQTTTTSCAHGCANGQCQQPSTNPYDSDYCTGPAMTQAQAVKFFNPGDTLADLGTYQMLSRVRDCNPVTGCGPWKNVTFKSYWPSNAIPMKGMAQLQVQGTKVQLRLRTGVCSASNMKGVEYYSTCGLAGDDPIKCKSYTYIGSVQWGGSGGTFCYGSNGSILGEPMAFSGKLTNDCLRLETTAKSSSKEQQAVIYLRF